MVMQIRRTATPNNPPATLAEGQLGVEMASSPIRLWCGVPTTVDPSGRKLIVPFGSASGATPPATGNVGDLFYDTANNLLLAWNGTTWITVGPAAAGGGIATNPGATAPATPVVGMLWHNTTTDQLFIWSGSKWQEVGGAGITSGAPAAPGEVGELLTGTFNFWVWGAMDDFNGAGTAAPPTYLYSTAAGGSWQLLTLTPGDWDVWATIQTDIGSAGTIQGAGIALSLTGIPNWSGVILQTGVLSYVGGVSGVVLGAPQMSTPPWPMNVTVSTPIFGTPYMGCGAWVENTIRGFARRRR